MEWGNAYLQEKGRTQWRIRRPSHWITTLMLNSIMTNRAINHLTAAIQWESWNEPLQKKAATYLSTKSVKGIEFKLHWNCSGISFSCSEAVITFCIAPKHRLGSVLELLCNCSEPAPKNTLLPQAHIRNWAIELPIAVWNRHETFVKISFLIFQRNLINSRWSDDTAFRGRLI